MRTELLCFAVVVSLFAGVPLASDTASAGPTPDSFTVLSGEKKTITFDDVNGSQFSQATQTGPIILANSNTDGNLVLTVQAKQVNTRKSATLFIRLSDGSERRVEFDVVPKGGSGNVNGAIRQDAQQYNKIENDWIKTRQETQTGNGRIYTVYEYRDPTCGPMIEEVGVPEGCWKQVQNFTDDGQPIYPYTSVEGLLQYMAVKANRNYGWQDKVMLTAGTIAVVPGIVIFTVVPWYRKRKEKKGWGSIRD